MVQPIGFKQEFYYPNTVSKAITLIALSVFATIYLENTPFEKFLFVAFAYTLVVVGCYFWRTKHFHLQTMNFVSIDAQEHTMKLKKIHMQLWKGSLTYRVMLQTIKNRDSEALTILSKEAAINTFKQLKVSYVHLDNIPFRSSSEFFINAVVFLNFTGDVYTIGSHLAFEVANSYQKPVFDAIFEQLYAGKFEESTDAAKVFMDLMEGVEDHSIDLMNRVIGEGLASGVLSPEWRSKLYNLTPRERLARVSEQHKKYYVDMYYCLRAISAGTSA